MSILGGIGMPRRWHASFAVMFVSASLLVACVLSSHALCEDDIALHFGAPSTYSSVDVTTVASEAYPNGTFAEQLSSAQAITGHGAGGSHRRAGPGRKDDWKVGPHWRVTADGGVLFREEADLAAIVAAATPAAPTPEFQDNFDHAMAGRLLITGAWPQCRGYELQFGYVGAEQWTAPVVFPQTTITAPGFPDSDIDVEERRGIEYESNLHALELNFQRLTNGYLKPFAGFRYALLGEDISDFTDQFALVALPNPPAGVGNQNASVLVDSLRSIEIDNNLVGFHGGLRLDMWRPTRRLHFHGFLSAGAYCNLVERSNVVSQRTVRTDNEVIDTDPGAGVVEEVQTTTTDTTSSSIVSTDGTNIAFTSQAALAGEWRLNSCTALRAGYQVFYLSGVELAEDAWIGLGPTESDLFLHGWFAGIEYRR